VPRLGRLFQCLPGLLLAVRGLGQRLPQMVLLVFLPPGLQGASPEHGVQNVVDVVLHGFPSPFSPSQGSRSWRMAFRSSAFSCPGAEALSPAPKVRQEPVIPPHTRETFPRLPMAMVITGPTWAL